MAAGAGYNIPISVSAAASTSIPQNSAAGTVFNFSSPGGGNTWYDQVANPVSTATATSSAALEDAVAVTDDSGNVSQGLQLSKKQLIYGGIVLVAVAIAIVMVVKSR